MNSTSSSGSPSIPSADPSSAPTTSFSSILSIARRNESLLSLGVLFNSVRESDLTHCVNEFDQSGSALLAAIGHGNDLNVKWLLERGASTHLTDQSFSSPMNLVTRPPAHRQYSDDMLRDVLRHKTSPRTEEIQWAVRFCIEESDGDSKVADLLDYCVGRLIGVDFSQHRQENGGANQMKYMSHVASLKGEVINQTNQSLNLEGWTTQAFLPMRIRSMFEILVLLQEHRPPAHLSTSLEDLYCMLVEELRVEIESFNYSIVWLGCKSHADRHACIQNIIERLRVLPVDSELALPAGWRGHAIYVSLVKCEKMVIIRIDNVGEKIDGIYNSPHPLADQRMHRLDPISKGYFPAIIGSVELSKLNDPEFDGHPLVVYLDHVISAITIPQQVDEVFANVYNQNGRVLESADQVEWPTLFCPSFRKQEVGNCVLESHSVGMSVRFTQALMKNRTQGQPYTHADEDWLTNERDTLCQWLQDREFSISNPNRVHFTSSSTSWAKPSFNIVKRWDDWCHIGRNQSRLSGSSFWAMPGKDLTVASLDLVNDTLTISNIPSLVEHFVPRQAQLRLLLDSSQKKLGTVTVSAVTGVPGSGKTELLKHVVMTERRRIRRQRLEQQVLMWSFNAETLDSIRSSFDALLHRLHISKNNLKNETRDESHARLFEILQQRLSGFKIIFLFDNAPTYKMIQPYIPNHAGLCTQVFVSSLNESFLVPESSTHSQLSLNDGLTDDEANQLLTRITDLVSEDDPKRTELVDYLDHLPLGVSTAGLFIKAERKGYQYRESSPNYSSGDYLQQLKYFPTAVSKREDTLRGVQVYDETLGKVIRLCIQRADAAYSHLLIVCYFLQSQAIPRDILQLVFCQIKDQGSSVKVSCTSNHHPDCNDRFAELLAAPNNGSLLYTVSNLSRTPTLCIHRSTQHQIRSLFRDSSGNECSMAEHKDHSDGRSSQPDKFSQLSILFEVIETLYRPRIKGTTASNERMEAIVAHLDSMLFHCQEFKGSVLHLKMLCLQGEVKLKLAYFDDAILLFQECRHRLRFGSSHVPQSLQQTMDLVCQNGLGEAHWKINKLGQARDYLLDCLKISDMVLDPNCQLLLAEAMSLLGNVLKEPEYSDLPGAREWHTKALSIRIQLGGEIHPDVVSSLKDIGVVCRRADKYDEALEYLHCALTVAEQLYGKHHEIMAPILGNIGGVLVDLNRLEEALEFLNRARKIYEREYQCANRYSNWINCLSTIGGVYRGLKDYKQALPYFDQTLRLRKEVFGNGASTMNAQSLFERGHAYEGQEQFSKSLQDYADALAMYQIIFQSSLEPKMHNQVAFMNLHIGRVHLKTNRAQDAIGYLETALEIYFQLSRNDRIEECQWLIEDANKLIVTPTLGPRHVLLRFNESK